jgi:hypothetical protein
MTGLPEQLPPVDPPPVETENDRLRARIVELEAELRPRSHRCAGFTSSRATNLVARRPERSFIPTHTPTRGRNPIIATAPVQSSQVRARGKIPIAPAAPSVPTSRDFVPWRFSDAGRRCPGIASSSRRPKTCTQRTHAPQQSAGSFDHVVGATVGSMVAFRPCTSLQGVDSHGEPKPSHYFDRCLGYSARSLCSPPSARPRKASVHRFIGCEWVEGIAGVYETNVTA